MKQIVREVGSGEVRVAEVPAPILRPGGLLVQNRYSVLSPGTERSKLELGRKSLLGKALSRPDDVRKVIESVAREGIGTTFRKVQGKLDELTTLGYSSAGVVIGVGEGVSDFQVGDHVACAGEGYAAHSEIVWIPRRLVARIPEGVPLERAAFSTLGAIALHGVRQADSRLGECVAVVGLGILGQLTVRLLRAGGVRVIAIDLDPERVRLAEEGGARGLIRDDSVADQCLELTGGIGVDAAILTAATSSADPLELACRVARDRARIVVVGDVPIEASRKHFFEKELELRISRSYGPGRYDPSYEERGVDYPIGYVRWTEGRNLEAFLELLRDGSLDPTPLVTHRFPIESAEAAYELVTDPGEESVMGVVLTYPQDSAPTAARIHVAGPRPAESSDKGRLRLGMIGGGSFARSTLLPALASLPVELAGIATARGTSALAAAERHGFRFMTGSPDEILSDPEIDAVLIATRHGDHARLAEAGLRAGKGVFVEKPLALSEEELDRVLRAAEETGMPLMVGFNRRFSPAARYLRRELDTIPGSRVVQIRVNAGALPPNHWLHDPVEGGGRWVGEGCHFVDLAIYLTGSLPRRVHAVALGGDDPAAPLREDLHVTLTGADGSLASILYTGRGSLRAGKERVEAFVGGNTAVLDDFRKVEIRGERDRRWKGRPDKGHAAELAAFVQYVQKGGVPPIPLHEIESASRTTLRVLTSLAEGLPQEL